MSTAFNLALAYLRQRAFATALNVILLSLGVATIIIVLLLTHQAQQAMGRDAKNIDLVVGAKGSPLQIILSTIYQLDVPTGNIALSDAQALLKNPLVKEGIPISMGDSYKGARIVGTTPAYINLYGGKFVSGAVFSKPFEAVVGARVATELNLTLGTKFVGAHGITQGPGTTPHDEHPLMVVGVLAPTQTVLDRVILVNLKTVWDVHAPAPAEAAATSNGKQAMAAMLRNLTEKKPAVPAPATKEPVQKQAHAHDHDHDHSHNHDHANTNNRKPNDPQPANKPHNEASANGSPTSVSNDAGEHKQITALLIRYATPLAAALLPREINSNSAMQAAVPAIETVRMFGLLDIGVKAFNAIAIAIALVAGLSIFIALWQALQARTPDLLQLRLLGAPPPLLAATLAIEGLLLAAMGGILGIVIGHIGAALIGGASIVTNQLQIGGLVFLPAEGAVLAGCLLLGAIAAAGPALRAYRMDISKALASG